MFSFFCHYRSNESTPYVFKRSQELESTEDDEVIEIDTLLEFNKLAKGNEYIKYQVKYVHKLLLIIITRSDYGYNQ